MVRVGVWRSAALLALCLSCLQSRGNAVSIIERDVEPTAFMTSAATLDTPPVWLVLPMLLDVQPVLLKVDVTRHVPTQIQIFCREHGMHVAQCTDSIQAALDEVVNFQRFCKKPTAESALPGFVVAKNVLRSEVEGASASWLQNDPEDVAMDFCDFARAKLGGSDGGVCIDALGKALQMSFEWMLGLTPCEQQQSPSKSEAHPGESEMSSIVDRLATVEEMIAALYSSPTETSEITSSIPEQEPSEDTDSSLPDEVTAIEEITENDQPATIVTPTQEANVFVDNILQSEAPLALEHDIDDVVSDANDEGVLPDQVDSIQHFADSLAREIEIAPEATGDEQMNFEEKLPKVGDTNVQMRNDVEVSEASDADNKSYKYSTVQDADLRRIEEGFESDKTWKIGAALVLSLSILYLAVDLMLHCVHYVAGHLEAPKQLVTVLLHDILVLIRGGPRSTLTNGYADTKKLTSGIYLVKEYERPTRGSQDAKSNEDNALAKPKSTTSSSSPPSFTCVAMMLMAGRHAPISHDTSLTQLEQQNLSTSGIVQSSTVAVNTIRQTYLRELVAVHRIQRAWKVSQHKSLFKRKYDITVTTDEDALVKSSAPIFRLLRERSKNADLTPRAIKGTAGLRRLVPNALPPM
ncbi:unnamed protein product [Phytophthora lilii]|uniref:Unnamed protein product n=1 Tax=Phytophthora lilii TaxID=2077276 RepID=A0A9W6UDN5_9STRA|nr:unnamed protein product [Phytophthora lilii]